MKVAETGRRSFRRRTVQLEVKITFRPPPSFSGVRAERLALVGRTRNLSETGVALVVSAGNIDRYLKAKDNSFDLELLLPDGAITLQSTPVYYKKLQAGTTATYLIGARFDKARTNDHGRLTGFLHALRLS